jgi:spermidine synthase
MSRSFEELARAATPMGEIVLRRRLEPITRRDIFEVMLGGDGLMSSLYTDGEEALAQLGLAALTTSDDIDVVVGGLGLGYTACTALDDRRIRSLHVIDTVQPVIDWHRRHLIPNGIVLTGDPRCQLVHADFFDLLAHDPPMLAAGTPERFDALLVDIDHSPQHLLDPAHAELYTPEGLRTLARHLRPNGVFALWSNDPPDDEFVDMLRTSFTSVVAEIVTFWNDLVDDHTHSTIYVAVGPFG